MIEPSDHLLPAGYRFERASATGAVVRIGTGRAGTVHLALNDVLGRRVAVKVVPARRVADDWSAAASIREAQTLAQLNHPNIVRVYDLAEHDDADVIVMEYVSGGTLADLIGTAGPGRAVRLRLLAETASGLGYLHRSGIVHRDIKPNNVLVTETGIAKIADFGLVTTADLSDDPMRAEIAAAIAGTPGHWSPEQARGEPLGPQSDVFSLATVAQQLLLGHASDRHRPHDRRSVEGLVHRCLLSNPADRPRDGTELHDLWCAAADREDHSWRNVSWRPPPHPFLAGEPLTARPPMGELETVLPAAAARAVRPPRPDPAPPELRGPVERLVVRAAGDTASARVTSRRVSRKVRRALMIVAGAGLGAAAGLLIGSRL